MRISQAGVQRTGPDISAASALAYGETHYPPIVACISKCLGGGMADTTVLKTVALAGRAGSSPVLGTS